MRKAIGQWEAGKVVEAHTPSDDNDDAVNEITLKVQYPDGRVRYIAVPARMTDKMVEGDR
jgi:hypothetical protein